MRWLKPTCSTYRCSVSTDSVPSLTFLFFNKDALGLFAVYLSTLATFEFHSTLWYFTQRWVQTGLNSSPIPHLWDEVAHQAWAARDHLAPVFDLSNARSLLSEQEQKPLQLSPTSAGKHLCCYIHLPAFPPYFTPPCSFYLSSVRSQTNNQIDKYDNISAVLSLKANLQFFGKRLSGCSRVISHQGGSNLGELTATNNQSFITELNATVLWPSGGRTRAALTEGGCFSPQCTKGLEPTSSVAVRRRVALWGKYKQMKIFKRLEI